MLREKSWRKQNLKNAKRVGFQIILYTLVGLLIGYRWVQLG